MIAVRFKVTVNDLLPSPAAVSWGTMVAVQLTGMLQKCLVCPGPGAPSWLPAATHFYGSW